MNSEDKWLHSMQMPPAGFGLVRQQPPGNLGNKDFLSNTNSGNNAPGQMYSQPVLQYQQVGGSQNWSQHQSQTGLQKTPVQSRKDQKFFEQKGKLMDFNRTKSKTVSADTMIESILSNPQTIQLNRHQSKSRDSPSQPSHPPMQQCPPVYQQGFHQKEANTNSTALASAARSKQTLHLPQWLADPSKVPEMYSRAGGLVDSKNGWVDTSRAYMLLMKTNLSPTLLGVLWEMVNREEPGRLRMTEFHGLLALIAVLQGGRQITNTDILATLDKPVYPFIDHPCLVNLIPNVHQDSVMNFPQMNLSTNSSNSSTPSQQPAPTIPHPTLTVDPQHAPSSSYPMDSMNSNISSMVLPKPTSLPVSTEPIVYPPPATKEDDDDGFADFVSAPIPFSPDQITKQTSVKSDQKMNLPILGNSPESPETDDFADFQSAPTNFTSTETKVVDFSTPITNSSFDGASIQSGLNSTADKYAAFRDFGTKSSNDIADFSEPPSIMDQSSQPQSFPTDIIESGYSDDPFGEFEEAPVTAIEPPPVISQNLKPSNSLIDDDFGDFVSSSFISKPPFNMPEVKSETQSIASLELPGLETPFETNLEDKNKQESSNQESSISDALFNLNFNSVNSSSHMDSEQTKTEDQPKMTSNWNLGNQGEEVTSTVESSPLSDKYSVIRDEVGKSKFSDPQIEAWRKCLEGCKKMLEDGFKILEKLSQQGNLLEECLKTSQMHDYLSNLNEVWKVSQRILTSCQRMSSSASIQDLLCSNQSLWASVISITEMKFDKLCDSHDMSTNEKTCSVCLNKGGAELLYGGLHYHAPCANLWLNSVDLTLPTLTAASLL